MEKRSWLVADLPGDAMRISHFAREHPRADIQLMHLGLENQGGVTVHRILLSLRGNARSWRELRSFFVDVLGAGWQDLPGGDQDALVSFTPETRIGDHTRALLAMWPHASVSCVRCRGSRTELYALAADGEAAEQLQGELQEKFDHPGIELRDLDSEERTWFRRLLDNPVLMAAMNR